MMTIIRTAFLLVAALCLITSTLIAGKDNQRRHIIARGDYAYPPYEFLDASGNPAGYNVDLIRAIGQIMDLDVEIRLGPWNEVRTDLEQGRIDMLLGMYYSPARDRLVDFTLPHTIVHHSIFVRKGSYINSLADLRSKQVIVQKGDIMNDYALENHITPFLVLTGSQLDAIRMLSSGRHDAALLAETQGLYHAEKYGLSNITTAGPPFQPRDYCFAVRQGDRELAAILNQGIGILKSTGRYEKIYNTWLGSMKPSSSMPLWLLPYGAAALGLALILIVAILAWTRLLKLRVVQRTRELDMELKLRTRAEEELRISNTLLMTQQETSLDGILIVDGHGRILSYNTRFATIWSIPEEILETRSDDRALSHVLTLLADPTGFIERVRYLYDHPAETSFEEIAFKDGRVFARYSSPIMASPEEYLGRVWYFRDVTAEHQAMKDILESEIRYRTLFENANDAIFTMKDAVFTDCNERTYELFGCAREDIIGRTIHDVSPPLQPDGGNSREQGLERISAAYAGQPQFFEWVHRRFDGTPFNVEISLKRIDIMGQTYLQAMVRDITMRKKAEAELQYEHKLNMTMIQTSPAFIVVISGDGRTMLMNRSMLSALGYAESEVIGRNYIDTFVPESEREMLAKIFQDITEMRSDTTNENRIVAKDGRQILVEWHGKAVFDGAGAFQFFFGMGIDITERRKAETQKDADQALIRESEARFRAIIDNMQDIYYRADMEGRITFASPSVLGLLGYDSLDQIIGFDIARNIYADPENRSAFMASMKKTGSVTGFETRLKRRDCSVIYVSTSSHFIRDDNGTVTGIEGILHDITENKRMESLREAMVEALRRSERRLADIIEFLPDATFIIDRDKKIIEWNRAMEEMTGAHRNDIIGKDHAEAAVFFYGSPREYLMDLIGKDDEEIKLKYYFVQRKGDTYFGEAYAPALYQGKGGYIWAIASPIYDNNGDIIGIIESIRDITDKRNAEEALRSSEETFRALAENSLDVIMRFDPEGRHLYVNPAVEGQTGMPPAAFIGKTHRELGFSAELCEKWEDATRFVIDHRTTHRIEFQLPAGNWIDWILMPEFDEEKKVKAVITSARDITEQKKMVERVRESLREKEVLLRELYHRTKNNMQVIYSLMSLEAEKTGNEALRAAFDLIGSKIRTMALVHQKLYESRDLTSISLNEYIADIVTLIVSNSRAAAGRISVDQDIDPCNVSIDTAIPFGLVLNELISNSVLHAFPGDRRGTIAITLRASTDEITLLYRDDGIGLSPEINPLESPSLGLTIIREIVRHQLHGRIRFHGGSGFSCDISLKTKLYRLRM